MSDLATLNPWELTRHARNFANQLDPDEIWAEILHRLERLKQCEAALKLSMDAHYRILSKPCDCSLCRLTRAALEGK